MKAVKLPREVFPRTWKSLEVGITKKVAPGFVCGIWLRTLSDQYYVASLGQRRVVPSPLPMLPDTVFDLASLTKILGTAALAAALVERGYLAWNTKVKSILPNYAYPEVEVQHLLSHTAGYCAVLPLWEKLQVSAATVRLEDIEVSMRQRWMKDLVLRVEPDKKPGDSTLYSDISFLVLGFVLEEVVHMPLDQAILKWIWGPMGLKTASFRRVTQWVEDSARATANENVAATESCPWRKTVLQGQVHDENCWAMGGYGGHAGAFGTIEDVMQFTSKMFDGYFSPAIRKALWTRVTKPADCSRSLGWDTPSGERPAAGSHFSKSSVGHLGFTGTSLWIDPEAGVAVALLSNRIHPSRDNTLIRAFRPVVHDSIRLDLESEMGIV